MLKCDKVGCFEILFFSRGKGRGHALPDAAIADELLKRCPFVNVTFVSYGIGATVLRSLNHYVIDLHLPEDPWLWDIATCVVELLRELAPALIISHEEFIVVPIAKAFNVPVLFLTDWLGDPRSRYTEGLKFADEIIFMDEPSVIDIPDYLATNLGFVGTVLRPLGNLDANEVRSQMNISGGTTVILAAPGSARFHTEQRAPIFTVVKDAFDILPFKPRSLLYVSDEIDAGRLPQSMDPQINISVMRSHDAFERTLKASDLLITTGNRMTILEAEALGIPSISLSFGHNPIDDRRIARIRTNVSLQGNTIDAFTLSRYMMTALIRRDPSTALSSDQLSQGVQKAADRIRNHCERKRYGNK